MIEIRAGRSNQRGIVLMDTSAGARILLVPNIVTLHINL